MRTKADEKLWLAVLARALSDCILASLDKENCDKQDLGTALDFVSQYPKILGRLKSIKSREALENWLEEVEKGLEEL